MQTLTLGQVGFALSREARARVESEALAQAIAGFKAKAAQVAESFGFSSYSLREVSINVNEQGARPRMLAMAAKSVTSDTPIPVEAGNSTVIVDVSGSVPMK